MYASLKTKFFFASEPAFWAASLMVVLGPCGCSKEQAAPAPSPSAVPVIVSKVTQTIVPVQLTSIGNVGGYTVSVEAQVSGQLLEVHFKEGDFVREGQLLFTIDPRPYEAALARSQAMLQKDRAIAANERAQAQRIAKLLSDGVVAPADAETSTSAADAADATVAADEAALKTDQLNLEYCTIYSPIDGQTGAVLVKPGNLVTASGAAIVVIKRLSPIPVEFNVPQEYLPELAKNSVVKPLRVEATVPGSSGSSEVGKLVFMENAVDTTTGTIRLRALFDNSRKVLWPGLYVNTVLTLGEDSNVTVVPAQAIAAGQQGSFVYVVQSDATVTQRVVVSSRSVNGQAVIDKGLQPGEIVVTDGQVRLVPGARIQIKNSLAD